MNTREKLELAHWAAKHARAAGADEVAVDVSNSRDISVQVRDRKLEELQESTQNGLNLSIYADHRYSNHSTNDMRRDSLGRFIDEAVAMTKYLSQDEFRSLPDPKYYAGQKKADLRLYDPDYEGLTTEERIRIAHQIEEASLAGSDQIITCTTGFEDSAYESVKVHSNGFEGSRRGTSFSCGSSVTVKGKDGGRPDDWDWCTVRFRKDLRAAEKLGETATKRALAKVGQKKIESGIYDMLVENRAASRLLGAIWGPLQARSLQQKRSFLEGKLGEKIASEKLTIMDDPFIETALGSRLYDGEGLATRKRTIIDRGVLKEFFIDWYYGRKLGVEPTGGSRTNTVFEYGTRSGDEMRKGMKKGILVTGFIGGNSNSTTGDFSYGIIGQYVENGKIVKPVNEMNISGNLADLLQQVTEVGNDPWVYSSTRRPSLYFSDVQFSGV